MKDLMGREVPRADTQAELDGLMKERLRLRAERAALWAFRTESGDRAVKITLTTSSGDTSIAVEDGSLASPAASILSTLARAMEQRSDELDARIGLLTVELAATAEEVPA